MIKSKLGSMENNVKEQAVGQSGAGRYRGSSVRTAGMKEKVRSQRGQSNGEGEAGGWGGGRADKDQGELL